jgi:hypothetical protein
LFRSVANFQAVLHADYAMNPAHAIDQLLCFVRQCRPTENHATIRDVRGDGRGMAHQKPQLRAHSSFEYLVAHFLRGDP